MLLWITHTTGIRVTELAQVEISDVLYPSGAVRPELEHTKPYLTASQETIRPAYELAL